MTPGRTTERAEPMTEQRRTALKELQKLDLEIQAAKTRIQDFDPLFEQVEEPALILESELESSRKRLKEMTLESRRTELSTEEKKERLKKLEERLGNVRNLREEAAVSAELEMIRRSLQNDEQEALHLMDQMRKVEERLSEVEIAFKEATEIVEPKKAELLEQRDAAKAALVELEAKRASFTASMPDNELRIYDAIRSGGRRVAVAELTEDGACGHCFGVVPLQRQNEIRHGESLIRCEGCGVILAAPEPESESPEPAAEESEPDAAADSDESTGGADDEDAVPAAVEDGGAGESEEE